MGSSNQRKLPSRKVLTTVSPDLIVGSDATFTLKKSNPEVVSFINGRSVGMKQEKNGWKY